MRSPFPDATAETTTMCETLARETPWSPILVHAVDLQPLTAVRALQYGAQLGTERRRQSARFAGKSTRHGSQQQQTTAARERLQHDAACSAYVRQRRTAERRGHRAGVGNALLLSLLTRQRGTSDVSCLNTRVDAGAAQAAQHTFHAPEAVTAQQQQVAAQR